MIRSYVSDKIVHMIDTVLCICWMGHLPINYAPEIFAIYIQIAAYMIPMTHGECCNGDNMLIDTK